MRRPLTLRRRLLALVMVGAVVTLAALILGFNALLRSNLDGDANRLLEARAAAARETTSVGNAGLRVARDTDNAAPDEPVWVFTPQGAAIESPATDARLDRLARSLAGTDREFADDPQSDTRLYSLAVGGPAGRAGTIVSGISLDPYERSAHRALVESLALAVALLVAIFLGVRLVVSAALRPVAKIAAEAANRSETDLDHRFAVGQPTDELTSLAATFDGMLDRLSESLRHEQRFTAEVSHELRTPLAAILAETDLALRRERRPSEYRDALTAIHDRAAQLQRIVETLLAAARAQAQAHGERADARTVVARLAATDVASDGPRIDVESGNGTPEPALAIGPDLVERILAPLLENARAHADSEVRLAIESGDEWVTVRITDDGPGVREEDRERVFEPGFRAAGGTADGAGLGLPLARRLARAVGGEVGHCPDASSGGCFYARLPTL